MTVNLSRQSFVQELLHNQGRVDINNPEVAQALEAQGLDMNAVRRAAGSDGVFSTQAEFNALFNLVDGLDRNGSSHSFAMERAGQNGPEPTAPALIFSALRGEATRQRDTQPYNQARFTGELQPRYGTIDIDNLPQRARDAFTAMGIDRARLEALAGPDHLIRGDELVALYQALSTGPNSTAQGFSATGFSMHGEGGALTPAGELFTALREHVDSNRLVPAYQRPGGQAELQQRRTVAGNALVVPADQQRPPVDLNMRGVDQFSLYPDDEVKGGKACYEGAVNSLVRFNATEHGRSAPRLGTAGGAIQVAHSEDVNGRVAVDPQRATLARDYIDRCLDARLPVVVGVSYQDDSYNTDRMTDHFITIDGRGYDDQGRLFYTFKDPGDGGRAGRLYVDATTGNLFKEGDRKTGYVRSADYEVTQVRTYVGAPT